MLKQWRHQIATLQRAFHFHLFLSPVTSSVLPTTCLSSLTTSLASSFKFFLAAPSSASFSMNLLPNMSKPSQFHLCCPSNVLTPNSCISFQRMTKILASSTPALLGPSTFSFFVGATNPKPDNIAGLTNINWLCHSCWFPFVTNHSWHSSAPTPLASSPLQDAPPYFEQLTLNIKTHPPVPPLLLSSSVLQCPICYSLTPFPLSVNWLSFEKLETEKSSAITGRIIT